MALREEIRTERRAALPLCRAEGYDLRQLWSGMIRVDISRALPASTFTYLLALIPGLFFEFSVFLGNPQFVHDLVERSQSGFALGLYGFLVIAVIVAFVMGVGFILFVRLIQRVFGRVYQLRSLTWKKLNELARSLVSMILAFLHVRPAWNGSLLYRWLLRFHGFAHGQATPASDDLRSVQECCDVAVRELLKRRYEIPEGLLTAANPEVWYWALWTPTNQELRGDMLVVAIHATGWCGLLATRFAPALWNRYYLGFVSLLIFLGALHDWSVAKGLWDPMLASLLRLRFALVALRRTKEASERAQAKGGGGAGGAPAT